MADKKFKEGLLDYSKHQLEKRTGTEDEKFWKGAVRDNEQRVKTDAERKIERRWREKVDQEYGGTGWRTPTGPKEYKDRYKSGVNRALKSLARAASKGTKGLGVIGSAVNAGEHYRASKEVSKDINKEAPFSTKLGAYVERVLGAAPGTTGRRALPSEREL